MKKVLVTGCAGFIGFHYSVYLLKKNYKVLGIDNLNNYYDVNLKKNRLKVLKKYKNFYFFKIDLTKKNPVKNFFKKNSLNYIVHLAAQAGVRYSLINPYSYIENNVIAYLNILECLKYKKKNIKIIYASSSSVYGKENGSLNEYKDTNKPIQIYAVSKKTNELMSEAYKSLFNMKFVGIRFFTVYGPWGRPDMALFLFTKAILNSEPIKVFNHGKMTRDFTYIDDIVESIMRLIKKPPSIDKYFDTSNPKTDRSWAPHRIFNIGNSNPNSLSEYINAIENSLNMKAKKEFLPMQPGDVASTFSDCTSLESFINYKPNTPIKKGVREFIKWYKTFYEY